MPTGIELSAGIVVGAAKPIDAKFGPYATTAAALADIPATLRYKGLTIGIETGGQVAEYWFRGGTADSDFVLKNPTSSLITGSGVASMQVVTALPATPSPTTFYIVIPSGATTASAVTLGSVSLLSGSGSGGGGGGGGTTFLPSSIAGLQLWLDASDSSTLYDSTIGGSLVTTNGAAVSRWEDKSGSGNHFTQATSNARPLLQTSSLNSKNGLLWDGLNDFMSGSVAGFKSFTAATIVLVCNPTTAAAANTNSASFWSFGSVGSAGDGYPAAKGVSLSSSTGLLSNERVVLVFEKNATGRLGSSTYTRSANQAVLITSTHSSGGTTLKQNSASVGLNLTYAGVTTSSDTSPAQTGYTLDDVVYLGALRSNGSLFASPQIRFYEALVFNKVLSAQEEQDLNSYLNEKWNLY